MKRWPAKLVVLPVVGLAALAFVCRPQPGRRPPLPEIDPEAEALAEGLPETAILRAIVKDQIAREVAAGRRALLEAAALFRELNKLPPAPAKPTRIDPFLGIPADTEAGWLCREVAEHVRVALHREPDQAAAAVARLEAEFFQELRACGAVRLPAPPPGSVEELLRQARARIAQRE
jgi:hypothetical protein